MNVSEAEFAGFNVLIVNLLFRFGGEFATVGALEVAKFDQSHRGVLVALEVACLTNQVFHQGWGAFRRLLL